MNHVHPAARHPLESLTAFRDTPCAEASTSQTFAGLLQPDDIVLDLAVPDKPALLVAIGQHMARAHGCNADWVTQSLTRREMAGSTAIGQGVAVPHARVLEMERIQVAYLRLKQPIEFDAPDGLPVSDVVVLLVPKRAEQLHLSILADTSRMFMNGAFRSRLKQARTAQDVQQLMKAWQS